MMMQAMITARDAYSRDHLRHAERGDNGIERGDTYIDDDDLDDYQKKTRWARTASAFLARVSTRRDSLVALAIRKQPAPSRMKSRQEKRPCRFKERWHSVQADRNTSG